jgi:dTDP-glucose pyrophosphorylase
MSFEKHIIYKNESVRDAFLKLTELRSDAILIVADNNNKLLGSLTDGDLRRGFIKGLGFDDPIMGYVQPDPVFIFEDELHLADTEDYRRRNIMIIPVVNRDYVVTDIINLRLRYSQLPVDVVIMAGGRGIRLMPLTQDTPKPMLLIGDKPIIEHTIDRLIKYGIKSICICVNYLADKIKVYFGDGSKKGIDIKYIHECKPLGTAGAMAMVKELTHKYILVMNSDLLTNIDLLNFFQTFVRSNADMGVATISYKVDIPYGVLEIDSANMVNAMKEKPRYTFYSNAGIYLLKKELLDLIPPDMVYNVTDLMEELIGKGKKIISYPIMGYWRDIGKLEDFEKAQEDIKYISL